jgi:hypothetical protein
MHVQPYAPPLSDLELAWDITCRVLQEGHPGTRMPALCMMACIVSRYPAGPLQDLAEDMLATFIAEADASPDEVELIRYFRASGFQPDVEPAFWQPAPDVRREG